MKHFRTLVAASAVFILLPSAACDAGADGSLLSKADFVDAYVDLRVSALRREDHTLTDSARVAVLARHGVTEDQLLEFASAHGGDLEFMRDLWNEVEARLDSVPLAVEEETP
jgi:hypothetical protein